MNLAKMREVGLAFRGMTNKEYLKKYSSLLIGLAILVMIILGWTLYRMYFGSNDFADAKEKVFFVSKGENFSTIVDSLESAGIIRSKSSFVFVARLHGGTTRVHVGRYKFSTGISNYELVRALTEGKELTLIPVTIPEGLTARQQAHLLVKSIDIDSARFVALVHDDSFARSLGISTHSLEGYLFPETYGFYWQPDEKYVIERLVGEFRSFYTDSLRDRASELGWTTNQVMTLASIVEGEAVLDEERPLISGVYHNRLRKGMRLEADPTIRYVIENVPRRILYSDLDIDDPYNTYRNRGLPPGPINNPGRKSILAALWPAKTNYLFFVANGKGGHWFSSNYAQHLRFVHRYRRDRRLKASKSLSEAARGR